MNSVSVEAGCAGMRFAVVDVGPQAIASRATKRATVKRWGTEGVTTYQKGTPGMFVHAQID